MPINIKSVGSKSSTAGKILKMVFATEDCWYYENFISLTLSTLAIARLLSSLSINILPNQITFDFWALVSYDLVCTAMLTHCYWHLAACWLVPPRMAPGLSGRTHHWGLLGNLTFYCTRQDEQNWCVDSQLDTIPSTAQQHSESYMGLTSCLKDCVGTMVWRNSPPKVTPAFAGAAMTMPSRTQAHRNNEQGLLKQAPHSLLGRAGKGRLWMSGAGQVT